MNRPIIRIVALVLALLLFGAACEGGRGDANEADTDQADRQQLVYQRNGQGVPFFDFSQDRETLRQIYVLKNENVATHTTFSSNGTGQIIDDCPSIGYPIPADTQLTNPDRPDYHHRGSITLPQPEPNGLYSSANTDGTWVICVTEDGKQWPKYSELKVEAYAFPIEVTADGFGIEPLAEPEVEIETGEVVNVGETVTEEPQSQGDE